MPLSAAQLPALKAAISAETDPTFVTYRTNGQTGLMAGFFNADSTFVVWRTLVTIGELGDKINGTELASLSSADTTRLQAVVMLSPNGFNPGLADRRQFFSDIFSGKPITLAALLAVSKRFATRGEKLYATGTGTNGSPGLLVFEGRISENDVTAALALP